MKVVAERKKDAAWRKPRKPRTNGAVMV